ncbi:MAG TPA: isoleucine--tRNA ligase [bacterium]|nr:isoleucine--tRNA ligase [bacterium]
MVEQKLNPLVEEEKKVQKFWQDNKIFEKTLAATKDGKRYSFYDGPPFATGTPHYGHIVASLMKDAVPRYQTMKGRFVERRWGWDCHGLPIENIVEEELKIKNKKQIEEEIGVDEFNETCRSKVLTYAREWRRVVERLGRFVDMDNDYKTMDKDFMETVWWVFKQLWDKGLIYQGYKSMHICPRCETTLSQSEVTEGYKDIEDLSVIASFELVDEPGRFVLAWTTTPWTLVGNVALAIGEKIDYVEVKAEEKKYILARQNLEAIFAGKQYEIIGPVKVKDLVGKKYRPLFDYYLEQNLKNKENFYTIVAAEFVTVEDGTGIVHIAPAFGEEDMNLGLAQALPFIQHVGMDGKFKSEVIDFAGEEVKPKKDSSATDRKVVEFLDKRGLVFKAEKFSHAYPHCWRCDSPLLNYATSSWFVKVTELKDKMLKEAKPINWVPGHIKDGRFGNWLEGARDWSISRQRFWGSVMPIWVCSSCGEQKVFGSVAELEQASGDKIEDLHKHFIDKIAVPCGCGEAMKRIPDVLDCWFESGSMPYAQFHYPFENEKKFEESFPAEFIAEGVDQTRAWFYYLHVLAVALNQSRAFDNVIANGIVLAEDGKKMAKRLKNYPEPELIMDKYGADALRYYLLSSPVMAAENLNFSEAGVKEAFQKVVMLAGNILQFYKLYEQPGEPIAVKPENILDRWLVAKLNGLIQEVTEAMDSYELVRAVRPIAQFIDEFSTWWLRRSRDRFKSPDEADKRQALATFRHTLIQLSQVMAPFTPFIAERIYQAVGGKKESVHLEQWPEAEQKALDKKLLWQMEQARKIAELGLAARAQANIKIRQPLNKLITKDQKANKLTEEFFALVAEELNVKQVEFLSADELGVELDTAITPELAAEGLTRELVRTINARRKRAGLTISDRIKISWESSGPLVNQVLAAPERIEELKRLTIAGEIVNQINDGEAEAVNGETIKLKLEKI